MKKYILILSFLFASCLPIYSQCLYAEILKEIEENNTLLRALRCENDALKLQNLTGLTLADPEVEFTYMWGQPSDVPNKINVGVSQSFDFATLSGAKKRVANRQNDLVELEYKQKCLAVLLEAEQTLVNLTYYNAIVEVNEQRFIKLKSQSEAYHSALSEGNSTIIDVNIIDLELKSVEADLRMSQIERDALLLKLNRLNGGKELRFVGTEFATVTMNETFEEWYSQAEQKNPMLQYLRSNIELGRETVSLSKSEGLPSFSVGYVNELIAGDNHHGVSIGLSVPLWSNRGKVKAAKASLVASQLRLEDAQLQFYTDLQLQYARVVAMSELANEYQVALNELNNKDVLEKALDAGEISIIEYVEGLQAYYDILEKTFETRRDFLNEYVQLAIYMY